uniref:non-specific serine/threonine protein kinase n=1 Tax=Chenopodium quinoa TaxID=63459 RepID=A0A803KLZ9_CHEQI
MNLHGFRLQAISPLAFINFSTTLISSCLLSDANEDLILSDPQGSNLWNTSSDLNGTNAISSAFMNDTGNFILTSSSNNNPIWQSFAHPTDTLLPTQIINLEGADTNFTKGRFQLRLQGDGNVVFNVMDPTIYWADAQPYYASNTWSPPNQGITEEQCKSSCLGDRFCAVATWLTETCCKYSPPFLGDHGSDVNETAWLKVGNGTYSTVPLIPGAKSKLNTVVSILLGGSVFFNIALLILAIFFIYHKKLLRSVEQPHEEYNNVHCFSYKALEEATDGFKEELGRGAFGVVCKSMITAEGSPIFVAVKKLNRVSNSADTEFKTEVNVIGKAHHKNLVRLVGFCKENDQRLLVYEYMRNGSLADYLFSDQRPRWVSRIQICEGIARGLLYLHEECSTQIIHCDIKPQNILLDDHQNALISDFGIAKLLAQNQTHTTTAIRGTKGYVAPEWFKNKPITVKEAAILTNWAFDCYVSNRLNLLVNDDMEAINDRTQLKRFVKRALWCIQDDPILRPSMRTVIQMLEGLVEVPAPPCPTSKVYATS